MIRRSSAFAADAVMCGLINLLQSRHRLNANSREEMEAYFNRYQMASLQEYYAVPNGSTPSIPIRTQSSVTWTSPIQTGFPANDVVRADLFPCASGWGRPTVLMLHALMSATRIGYR